MTKHDYEALICHIWNDAKPIPFRSISIDGWVPAKSRCHENVNVWTRENKSHSAVRGWINNHPIYGGVSLVSHSIVKDENGDLFDITPFEVESLRRTTFFISHIGDIEIFERFRNDYLECKVDIAE